MIHWPSVLITIAVIGTVGACVFMGFIILISGPDVSDCDNAHELEDWNEK